MTPEAWQQAGSVRFPQNGYERLESRRRRNPRRRPDLGEVSDVHHSPRRTLVAAVAIGALVLPGVASANTGYVACEAHGRRLPLTTRTSAGARSSTETVNGVTQQFTVPAHTAVTHTWPGVSGTSTAGAIWSGGSIPKITLHCPSAPPPAAAASASAAAPGRPPRRRSPGHAAAGRAARGRHAGRHRPSVAKVDAAEDLAAQARARQGPCRPARRSATSWSSRPRGGTARDVVVCDKLPDHMTYVSLGTATLQDGKACWYVGDLSGSLTLSLTAQVDADAPDRVAHEQRHGDVEQRRPRQGLRHDQGAGQATASRASSSAQPA